MILQIRMLVGLLIVVPFLTACTESGPSPSTDTQGPAAHPTVENEPESALPPLEPISATLLTSKGPVELVLFADKSPLATANFVNLAQRGFYNGQIFFRVVPERIVQAGCPEGTGFGGPGYTFADQFHDDLRHDEPGTLSMANHGPDTNGSVFFITLSDGERFAHLNGRHAVFGRVADEAGLEVLAAIEEGDVIEGVRVQDDAGPLFMRVTDRLGEWNAALDARENGLDDDD